MLLLGLAAAELCAVPVVGAFVGGVGVQHDVQFAIRGVLDGDNGKAEIGTNCNIHCFRIFVMLLWDEGIVKIQKKTSDSTKKCNFAT